MLVMAMLISQTYYILLVTPSGTRVEVTTTNAETNVVDKFSVTT